MGCCGSADVDRAGQPKKEIKRYVWGHEVTALPYSPFYVNNMDAQCQQSRCLEPPPCKLNETAWQEQSWRNGVPAMELHIQWPHDPEHYVQSQEIPWDKKTAVWLNTCWVKAVAKFPAVTGREHILFAAKTVDDGAFACMLLSTGWLLVFPKKVKSGTPEILARHLLEMKSISVSREEAPVNAKSEQVSNESTWFCVMTFSGQACPNLPQAGGEAVDRNPSQELSISLTRSQTSCLLGALQALGAALGMSAWEVIKVPDGLEAKRLKMPPLPFDAGFLARYSAMLSCYEVPPQHRSVGLSYLEGLPFMDLDITLFEPLAADIPGSVHAAYCLKQTLLQSTNFKSLTRRGQSILPGAFQHLVEAVTGRFFKLELSNCRLTAAMVAGLTSGLLQSRSGNTILDLDLSGAQINTSEAVSGLVQVLEKTPSGMRRIVLQNCQLSDAYGIPLLKALSQQASKLEHLSLAGNRFGVLPDPHPLQGIARTGKLQTLDLAGTGFDISKVLDGPPANGSGLRTLDLTGTSCSSGQQLAQPVLKFLSTLSRNLESFKFKDSLAPSKQVYVAFYKVMDSMPSKKFTLDCVGFAGTELLQMLCEEVKNGPLPGANELVVDRRSLSNTATFKGAPAEFGTILKNQYQGMEQLVATESIKQQSSSAKPAEKQQSIARTLVARLKASDQAHGTLLMEAAKTLAGSLLKRLVVQPDPQAVRMQLLPVLMAGDEKVEGSVVTPSMQVRLADQFAGTSLAGPPGGPAVSQENVKPLDVDNLGMGPALAMLIAPFAESKALEHLDISNALGGDAVGIVLGSRVLRTNRSIRSLRVAGNYFGLHGWSAVRGAFYGNKKVVDFPFPERDNFKVFESYKQRILKNEQEVLECRGRIKMAFKSTKGARTQFVLNVLNQEVENIKRLKTQAAKLRSTITRLAKLQQEIQQSIDRNQKDAKNIAKNTKERMKEAQAARKEAEKASQKAMELEKQKEAAFAQQKQKVIQGRVAALEAWNERVTKLKKSKKDVAWFEQWAQIAAQTAMAAGGAGGAGGPRKKPVLNYETADILLALVPKQLEKDCDKEIKQTLVLRDDEYALLAEQEALDLRVKEQKAVVASAHIGSLASPPPAASSASSSNAPNPPPPGVVQGIVIAPPTSLATQPIADQNKKTQALQYQQFQSFLAAQTRKKHDFMAQSSGKKGSSFSHAFAMSQARRRPGKAMAGAALLGGGVGVGGAALWMYHQHDYDEEWERRRRQEALYDRSGYEAGQYDHVPDGSGAEYDSEGNPLDEPLVPVDDAEVVEEVTDAEALGEAQEAVDMYAGGEDDRCGGGPPPSGSRAVRSEDPSWLNPTPPRLDVLEWFEHHIREIDEEAKATALGRSGPLPCPSEVLVQSGPEAPSGVCLVTQCSLDRLCRLESQLCAWEGEVAAAVFVDGPPYGLHAMEARRDIVGACSRAAAARYRLAPHRSLAWSIAVVYQLPDAEVRCRSYDRLYPVNTLRNVALSHARSELVFLLDVDFIPSRGLYNTLVPSDAAFAKLKESLSGGDGSAPTALVVPAFEVQPDQAGVPQEFEALRTSLSKGHTTAFHVSHFPKGHSSTDFERWLSDNPCEPRRGQAEDKLDEPVTGHQRRGLNQCSHGVDAYPATYTEHFEPYVVTCRKNVPAYDERFRGYGLNKISHLYDMAKQGFEFRVLAHHEAFVAAAKHPRSQSWQQMYGPDADGTHRARLAAHFVNFKKEVELRSGQLRRRSISRSMDMDDDATCTASEPSSPGKAYTHQPPTTGLFEDSGHIAVAFGEGEPLLSARVANQTQATDMASPSYVHALRGARPCDLERQLTLLLTKLQLQVSEWQSAQMSPSPLRSARSLRAEQKQLTEPLAALVH